MEDGVNAIILRIYNFIKSTLGDTTRSNFSNVELSNLVIYLRLATLNAYKDNTTEVYTREVSMHVHITNYL